MLPATYLAAQATTPGQLELVRRPVVRPNAEEVLIRVEACGMCGADVADIERPATWAGRPTVPGHEVVGRIILTGSATPASWQVGQRVGVGRLGGHCGICIQCRRGQFQLCTDRSFVGSTTDGGYAEYLLAKSSGLIAIPEKLTSMEAAPLLCAGVATFNAVKKSGAEPGDLVAIAGIGGLGHMAVQYARKMGFETVALGRRQGLAEEAERIGSHHFCNVESQDAAQFLQALGGATAIISTISEPTVNAALAAGLAPGGRMMLLGGSRDPIPFAVGQLIVGERGIVGSITGTPYEAERTLQFSILTDVRPKIEIFRFADVRQAYAHLKSGSARFRTVLEM